MAGVLFMPGEAEFYNHLPLLRGLPEKRRRRGRGLLGLRGNTGQDNQIRPARAS